MCLPLPSQGRFIPYLGLWMPKSTPYFTHAILLNKQESHWYLWVQSTVPWKVHIPWDCRSLLEYNFLCFKSSNNNTKNITNSLRKSAQHRKLLLTHLIKYIFYVYIIQMHAHICIYIKENQGSWQDKIYNLKALYMSHSPFNTSKCLHPSFDHFH